ncbi:conserved oligomeric Golgi complex subunit 8 [Heteronotia binoei]|uniref:conserved oligomeric Golgi complex subunit 8 n=1 Tax=Heteronotia binoei TaxID=13085 RepID=UPI0029313AC9|nr:conserved oligomeric Golgi complex subunit 8 [Heteronotia binoei]
MAEEASLLAWLFRGAPAPSGDAELPAYLAELSGLGLEALRREPGRLAEERAQLGAQTRALAFAHYKTFIRSAECTAGTRRGFAGIEEGLDRLRGRLAPFAETCRTFSREAEHIAQSRHMNSLTLNRHTEILEVLEIPQLMDTCVRNSYHEEALGLVAYVRRLEKKHADIPVIQGIVAEVRQSTQLMLTQLIQQLRTNIQLPACLRLIGYLRCMDVFTEAELRITFLQSRDIWLRSILAAIPDDSPYVHITKTIEACRVHLFDIITQYRAIFADEEPLVPPSGQEALNESAIFHGWVLQKVSQFLQVLEQDLQRGVGGRLDSLLGQCMYFGLSFSRVGADFRGQLAPIFQQAALQTFQKAVQEAVNKFQEEMNSYTLISAPAALGSTIPVAMPTAQPATLQPPMVLLDFPPLACFLNNILVAFNDLRLCCPVALAQEVAAAMEDALRQATKIILAFHRAEEMAFSSREQELFAQLCMTFLEDLVPYLNRCLQLLFPPAQIAQTLGVPPTQLQKYGNFGCVNEHIIQELLAPILPDKETVCLLDKEKGLPQESPASPLVLELPALAQEASHSSPVPVSETEDSGQDSRDDEEVTIPPAPEYGGMAGPGRALLLGGAVAASWRCRRGASRCSAQPEKQRSYWQYLRRLVVPGPAAGAAQRRVCQVGDPVLRGVAAPVASGRVRSAEVQALIAALVRRLRREGCVGLSAPQLGVPLQVFVAELPERLWLQTPAAERQRRLMQPFPLRVFVNPALRVLDARLLAFPEGCCSLRGFSAYVPRYRAVHVAGLNEAGEETAWEATGWAARIVQHEMDHLQGILYIDKMDSRSFTNVHWEELKE